MFRVVTVDFSMEWPQDGAMNSYLEWCRQRGWDNYSVVYKKKVDEWVFFFKENVQVRTEHKKIEPTYENWQEALEKK